MGMSPSQQTIDRHLAKAKHRADAYASRYCVKCEARVQRASNGEVAIVYDITKPSGVKNTVLSVNEIRD